MMKVATLFLCLFAASAMAQTMPDEPLHWVDHMLGWQHQLVMGHRALPYLITENRENHTYTLWVSGISTATSSDFAALKAQAVDMAKKQ